MDTLWTELLPGYGHTVRLFGAGREDVAPERIATRTGEEYEYQVVSAWYGPRGIRLSRRLGTELRRFDPEFVIWLSPSRYFGRALLTDPVLRRVPVASEYSEGPYMHEFDWRKRGIGVQQRVKALGFHLLRGRAVRAACRRSFLVIGNTPLTRDVLLVQFHDPAERAIIARKIADLPLGFLPSLARWDPALRRRLREELGLGEDDIVVCRSSRFDLMAKQKLVAVENSLSAIRQAMGRNDRLKAVIIGFTDSPLSQRFRRFLSDGPFADRFICHDWASQERLMALYNAVDIAAFGSASISCQSAIGTGLVVVLADTQGMNHLVSLPDQGFIFRMHDREDMTEKLLAAANVIGKHSGKDRERFRARLVEGSRWLGYDRVVEAVMKRLEDHLAGNNSERGISVQPAGAWPAAS